MIKVIQKFLQFTLNKFGFTLAKSAEHESESLKDKINASFVAISGGVLHIGAHMGQEAEFYERISASVIWIEANPELYETLKLQIARFPKQIALNALVGDENLDAVRFNISSNSAHSSSIYEFGPELEFKNLTMSSEMNLPMVRLDSLLNKTNIEEFAHWVLDVQGAELKVLIGAGSLLNSCNSIKVEISTRQVYKGGTKYTELKQFLAENNFFPLWEPESRSHEDIIFIRV